jgi:DNA polymerase-3 subunit epsilon
VEGSSPLSWADGPLLGFDMETTGPEPSTAVPVSFAFVLKRGNRMSVQTDLIDPGVPIPPDATEIHGITDEMAARGRPLGEAVEAIKSRLLWAEARGIPLVTQNGSYDLTIIHRLAGLSDWDGPVFDVYVLDKALHKYRKGSRTLSALADHYQVDMSGAERWADAHDAAGDAVRSVLVLLAMVDKWPWMRASDPAKWHKRQLKMWADQQRASLSEYFVEQGKEPIPWEDYGWPIKRGVRASLDEEGC